MGTDEMAMIAEVEDEFEIEVSDSDAEQSRTVGKLVDVVHSRLRQNPDDPCSSQHGFYVVRRHLTRRLELPRSAIRPGTRLEELLPRTTRHAVWPELIRALGSQRSDRAALVRSRWLSRTVFLLLPAAAFLVTLALTSFHLWWLGILLALGVARLGARMTRSCKIDFPPGMSRAEDLIRLVETRDGKIWSREEVVERVRQIAVEQFGVRPEPVALEPRRWTA